MSNYPVPATSLEFSEEIKKSRFLTLLRHTAGKEEAKAWILEVRAQHPQARHCCWASIAGAPEDGQGYGFSDDGEPAGTAGKPLLNQLRGSGLGEVTAIVVRYYGGIKLGTGGLVRAYSSGVAQLLKEMPRHWVMACQAFELWCDYDEWPLCQWALAHFACENIEVDYGEQIRLQARCPCDEREAFEQLLRNRTHGRITLMWIDKAQEN